jgi:uncharacterized lipoprotein NlpE involved in copper resistance
MKKLLVIAVVFVQVATLIQIGTHFASAATFTQCSDGINNDPAQDSLVDAADPGCHSDFNASNSSSYDSNLNSEINPSTGDGSGSGFTQCSDGINNDPLQDSLIDAADPGCHSDFNASNSSSYDSNLNSEINPSTSGGTASYQCNDGSDNDHDGRTDMNDPDCASSTDNSEFSSCLNGGCDNSCDDCSPPPPPIYECSDDQDNDHDGHTDYPSDPGCSGPTDKNEYNAPPAGGGSGSGTGTNTNTNTNTNNNSNTNINNITIGGGLSGGSSSRSQCDDNRDNDGDGDVDYPEDRGCSSRNDDSEYGNDNDNDEPQCDDNRDNDNDGDEDYPEDRGCSSRNDDSENSDRNGSGGNDDEAPYFISTPSNSVVAGQTYSYNADAVSSAGQDITYSLAVNPSGMTINSFTGQVQWFVPSSLGNTYQPVLVVATDDDDNQATQSFIISVRGQVLAQATYQAASTVVRSPVSSQPAEQLRISNIEIGNADGDVFVSFRTNIDATGSVRFGPESELERTSGFTYPVRRTSDSGDERFHEVNLGSLAPNRIHYIRAFATAGSRSAISPELVYIHTADGAIGATAARTEVAGTDSCFDGLDNDRDGLIDSLDPECEVSPVVGRVAGAATFGSTFEGLGNFLLSPWLLFVVIIVLVAYIMTKRRRTAEVIHTNSPIEIRR